MKIYSLKINGYTTHCHIKCNTLSGGIKKACEGLSVIEDDILEIKRVFRAVPVEFETKK